MQERDNKDQSEGLLRELGNIYTSLEEAKREVWRRWNNKKIKDKISDLLKKDIPEPLLSSPRSVIGRHVLSPNFELFQFLKQAEKTELKPLCIEYVSDKFVGKSVNKYFLCKMFFHKGYGKNGGSKLSSMKIVDFNNAEGNTIQTLNTVWGENVVSFHHRLVSNSQLDKVIDKFDLSTNLKKNGAIARHYYPYYLSLFLCHGILFEDYSLDSREADFTKNIVLPSIKKIVEETGLKPLIVKLHCEEMQKYSYWQYYPAYLEDFIVNSIKKNKNGI